MGEVKETIYGTVASDWDFIPANIYCEKVTDGTHDSPKAQASGKHLITSKHIRGREIDFDNAYLINEDEFNKINLRSKVNQWDVIISMIGEYCGFCYVERNEIVDYAVKNVGMLKTGTKTKAMWLYYFLNSKIGKSILEANKSGTSQPYLTLGFLRELPVLYPNSDKEAERIVEVLSSLDDKIDLLHRQNKTLEALAETFFRQWFVEEAEESWEEAPLTDFFDFLEGPGIRNWQYTDSGTPFINIRLINDGEIDVSKANFVSNEEALGKYKHFLLQEDDMIVSTSGTLGKTAIVRSYHLPLMLNTSVIRFRPKDGKSYSFIYQYLKSRVFQDHLEATASGSVQANFGPTHLKQMHFLLPSQEALDKYLKEANSIYEKIKRNYLQVRTLTTLRDSLLPKLMSGEVRVKIAEAETAIASQ